MKYFEKLDFPDFDLYTTLQSMIAQNLVTWHMNQLCVNTVPERPDDHHYGVGSLDLDYDKAHYITRDDGEEEFFVPPRKNPLKESDFSVLCNVWKDTSVETLFNHLKSEYNVGRVRFMKTDPRYCMSWHTDYNNRIHYVVKTQPGCLMVIEDEVHHMPQDTWWKVATHGNLHTALNGSNSTRIHMVANIF